MLLRNTNIVIYSQKFCLHSLIRLSLHQRNIFLHLSMYYYVRIVSFCHMGCHILCASLKFQALKGDESPFILMFQKFPYFTYSR